MHNYYVLRRCPSVLYLQMVAVQVSVLTNVSIGIDRLWAVRFPLRSRVTASRWKLCVSLVWSVALLAHFVQLFVGRTAPSPPDSQSQPKSSPASTESTFGISSFETTPTFTLTEAAVGESTSRAEDKEPHVHVSCGEQWGSWTGVRIAYTMFVLHSTYLIPLAILAVTYSLVAVTLWRRRTPGNADENRDRKQLRGRIKVRVRLCCTVLYCTLCLCGIHRASGKSNYFRLIKKSSLTLWNTVQYSHSIMNND